RLAARYARAFSGTYRAAVTVERAADDVVLLDAAAREGVRVVLRNEAETTTALRFYLAREPLVLSEFMPVLENLGLRVLAEDQEGVTPAGAPRQSVQTFFVQDRAGRQLDPEGVGARLPAALLALGGGRAESGTRNRLGVGAGLGRRAGPPPAPAPTLRDLRPRPDHGGHPPPRGQGGARRHSPERPPRGLPHRDPGPHEDADGEERAHRPDRGEGRLRRQGDDAGGRG